MRNKPQFAPEYSAKLSPLDFTRPLETVNGQPVRVLATDLKRDGELLLVVAVSLNNGETEFVVAVRRDGALTNCGGNRYIRNVPPVVTHGYRLMFPNGLLGPEKQSLDSAREARERVAPDALIIKITFIDGVAKDVKVVDEEQQS